MIPRLLSDFVRKNASWFPVVSVAGPRQSGKSTLVRAAFPDYEYVNLERPDVRELALRDPVGFIRNRPRRLIIDEAQLAPELFNMIQVASDELGIPGQYVLSGTQNFLMKKGITQSLAGRVGLTCLLPLSYKEMQAIDPIPGVAQTILRGGYPRIYDVDIPVGVYYRNYLDTYVARDVSGQVNASNLGTFRRFFALCAQMSGNLLNLTRLASDVGVSVPTARSWLNLLVSSYLVFLLPPYHANVRKRLTKTPKLYFLDTGLLCYLLGIEAEEGLPDGPSSGAVFENFVIAETYKRHVNVGEEPQLFFYRDDSKVEVDLVDATRPQSTELVEIKSSQTFRGSFLAHLDLVGNELGIPASRRGVVMRADETTTVQGDTVWSLTDWLLR